MRYVASHLLSGHGASKHAPDDMSPNWPARHAGSHRGTDPRPHRADYVLAEQLGAGSPRRRSSSLPADRSVVAPPCVARDQSSKSARSHCGSTASDNCAQLTFTATLVVHFPHGDVCASGTPPHRYLPAACKSSPRSPRTSTPHPRISRRAVSAKAERRPGYWRYRGRVITGA